MPNPEKYTGNVYSDLFEARCRAAEWQSDGCPTDAETIRSQALAQAAERLGSLQSADNLQFFAEVEYERTWKELEGM